MAIYRKKKFTSHKKVGGPEIRAATGAKKCAGRGPSSPIGSAANNNVNYKSTRLPWLKTETEHFSVIWLTYSFISIICQLTGYRKSTEAQQAGRLVKKVMKISIFRIQLFSDTVTFRSYGLCQRAGRVGVDPPRQISYKKLGGLRKQLWGINPPYPPDN